MTSESLWNYYRYEINDDGNENDDNGNNINYNNIITSKSFEYKTKFIGTTPNNYNILDKQVVVSVKFLINLLRSLDLPLINCRIELNLSIITEASKTYGSVPNTNPVRYQVTSQKARATLQISNIKLYVPVVTLSINDNIKFLQNIKQGFKRTISCKKYRSEITTQSKNNNLDYLIDPTFSSINVLSLRSFKNINARETFLRY